MEGQGNITLELQNTKPHVHEYIITGGSFEFTWTPISSEFTCQPVNLTVPAESGALALELWQEGSDQGKVYDFFPRSEIREVTFQCRDRFGNSFPLPGAIQASFHNSSPLPYTNETVLEATNTPLGLLHIGQVGVASWRLAGE